MYVIICKPSYTLLIIAPVEYLINLKLRTNLAVF
jgi:hypothetical protein